MKKCLLWGLMSLSFLTYSCQDEELVEMPQVYGNHKLEATFEGFVGSRTTETDGKFGWQVNTDLISVYNGTSFDEFKCSKADGVNATFMGNLSTGSVSQFAVYPSSAHKVSGTGLTVNLKKEYDYTTGTNSPMVAEIGNNESTLNFHHVGGIIRFVVNNLPADATKFVFTSTEAITGDFAYDNSSKSINLDNETTASTDNNNVTIKIAADSEGKVRQGVKFYVPLPVGSYDGFSVDFYNDKNELVGYSGGKAFSMGRADVKFTSINLTSTTGAVSTKKVKDDTEANVALQSVKDMTNPGLTVYATSSTVKTWTLPASFTSDNNTSNSVLNIIYEEVPAEIILKQDGADQIAAAGKSRGVVNITIPQNTTSQEIKVTIDTPYLTVKINDGVTDDLNIKEVSSRVANGTLILGEKVTVSALTANGGNIEVNGTVETLNVSASYNKVSDTPVEGEKTVAAIKVNGQITNLNVQNNSIELSGTGTISAFNDKRSDTDKAAAPLNVAVVTTPSEGGSDDTTPSQPSVTIPDTAVKVENSEEVSLRAAALNGGTYTLKSTVELDKPLVVTADLTLNLGGFDIVTKGADVTELEAVTGTVTTDALIVVRRGGKLTVQGDGMIDSKKVMVGIKVTDKNDAEVPQGTTGDANMAQLIINTGTSVNGPTIKGYNYAISGNGQPNRKNTSIEINGGTIQATATTDNKTAIFHPQDGEIVINGGIIEGQDAAVEMRSGKLTLNGGQLTSKAKTLVSTKTGNGASIAGAALAISQHSTNLRLEVDIPAASTAKLTGPYAIYEEDLMDGTNHDAIKVTVAGGEFFGQVMSKTADQFEISGGTFDDFSVAQYATGTTSPTIKLQEALDISSINVKILENTKVILDLNGKVLTATGKVPGNILVNGELTIKSGVSGGQIVDDGNGSTYGLVRAVGATAKITLESGKIDAGEQYGVVIRDGADFAMTGGEIIAGKFALSGNNLKTTGGDNTDTSTIDISGGKLSSTNDYAILLTHLGETNISSTDDNVHPEIAGVRGAIAMRLGNLNISGGTLKSGSTISRSGSEGMTNAVLNVGVDDYVLYGDCDVTISGGTFSSIGEGTVDLAVSPTAEWKGNTCTADVSISGGTFSDPKILEYLTEDADVDIKLVKTETVNTNYHVSAKNVTINLNNQTLNYVNENWMQQEAAIFIRLKKGTLTFEGTGTINSDGYIVSVNSGCILNVNGNANYNTVKQATCISVNGGTANISQGTFKVNENITVNPNGGKFLLNLIDNSNGTIIVTGGIFHGYDPSNSESENPLKNFVHKDYESKKIDGNSEIYKVSKKETTTES